MQRNKIKSNASYKLEKPGFMWGYYVQRVNGVDRIFTFSGGKESNSDYMRVLTEYDILKGKQAVGLISGLKVEKNEKPKYRKTNKN